MNISLHGMDVWKRKRHWHICAPTWHSRHERSPHTPLETCNTRLKEFGLFLMVHFPLEVGSFGVKVQFTKPTVLWAMHEFLDRSCVFFFQIRLIQANKPLSFPFCIFSPSLAFILPLCYSLLSTLTLLKRWEEAPLFHSLCHVAHGSKRLHVYTWLMDAETD